MGEDGLTDSPEAVVVLKGTIVEIEKNKSFKFSLWTEDNGRPQLPIRFEYKARSFPRVSFERDASQAPNNPS